MTGPLDSIFAAVEPGILANMATASVVPTFGHTAAERLLEAATPRVVWAPMKEDFQPARGQGGDSSPDSAGNMILPGGALSPLYTRVVDVETDIWGPDRGTVEFMINCVVSAVHDALSGGSYGIVGATWLEPESYEKNGETYRLTFQFLVPVVRVAPTTTTATMTTIPVTPGTPFRVGS